MSKTKKLIISLVIVVVIAIISVCVVNALRNKNQEKKTANVFAVSDMMYTADMVGDYSYLSGMVSVDKEQSIYLTSTDVIEEVLVEEGDVVKAGDVILVYDVTSQNLQLETKRAEVELARAAVVVAENELEKLNNTTPVEIVVPPVVEEPATEAPVVTEEPTTEAPVVSEEPTTEEPESTEEMPETSTDTDAKQEEPTTEEVTVEEPTTEEPTTESVIVDEASTEVTDQEALPEVDEATGEITYTAEELAQAIKDKKAEISRLTIDYQLQQIELQILEYQYSTGEVICNFDGIVKKVIDEETALLNNEPFIVVSGTEGYTVETAVGELDLMSVNIGDMVSLYCYDNGMMYYGTITSISDVPSNEYNYSMAEESFYPVTISIDDGTDLTRGMYMEITLMDNSEDASNSFYIELAMVKKENGNYYVMKEEDGKLVKSYIKTGEVLWGSMIEIKAGLSYKDYIAFPYSKDAVEGVHTVHESMSVLYQ